MDVLSRWLWEWKGLVQREGQARQGRLSVCAQGLCKDAKPTKHTQTLALRKARVIKQMRNHISTQTIAVRKVIGIARFLKWVVRSEGGLQQ